MRTAFSLAFLGGFGGALVFFGGALASLGALTFSVFSVFACSSFDSFIPPQS